MDKKQSGLHVIGIFSYELKNNINFSNPIKTGMRPVMWYDDVSKSTSIQIISKDSVSIGEEKEIEIVILSPSIFKGVLIPESTFIIGNPGHRIGTFKLKTVID